MVVKLSLAWVERQAQVVVLVPGPMALEARLEGELERQQGVAEQLEQHLQYLQGVVEQLEQQQRAEVPL